jgi:hypothetical protein
MSFRKFLAFSLLLATWFSFHAESELHLTDSHAATAFHVADLPHSHDDASIPYAPRGEHKDQHGCYHSHAPFVVPTINVDGKVAFTPLAAELAEIPYSLSLTNILHPPRV